MAKAEQEDFRFWFDGFSPEERVIALDSSLLGYLKTGKRMPQRDYEEFLESLNANGVKYILIGAHAVAFYAAGRRRLPLGAAHVAG